MPQIFPMNWLMISMLVLMIFFLIKTHIFFFKPFKTINSKNWIKNNKLILNFKW
uniref:ATP synthase F0 subunit 8 n=2 Tax=Hyalomma asiaticum TaxID=266040 RepID=A0A7T8V8K9_HYAAI|nr:ATP synthase F0 subunit 8 [Hyalomma asiaticum]AUQ23337.1 ATP synthase subunit 8 [Hyalomma asiaticum asiaticum]QQQ89470.1 ATP synthase F0 subunit 8 [Hyalomma asiaticum]QVV23860.1 ATP synthase subunit 8 [Hyalomma asiaticum]UNO54329.1 ATP synthase F0 subunit 8 [Hyalomma asiaticum]UNO54342.1 ATP synthase F0 subunit 8 [Hyalomma asiaticum]